MRGKYAGRNRSGDILWYERFPWDREGARGWYDYLLPVLMLIVSLEKGGVIDEQERKKFPRMFPGTRASWWFQCEDRVIFISPPPAGYTGNEGDSTV